MFFISACTPLYTYLRTGRMPHANMDKALTALAQQHRGAQQILSFGTAAGLVCLCTNIQAFAAQGRSRWRLTTAKHRCYLQSPRDGRKQQRLWGSPPSVGSTRAVCVHSSWESNCLYHAEAYNNTRANAAVARCLLRRQNSRKVLASCAELQLEMQV